MVRKPIKVRKPVAVKPKSKASILARLKKRVRLSHSEAKKKEYMQRLNAAEREWASQRKKAA